MHYSFHIIILILGLGSLANGSSEPRRSFTCEDNDSDFCTANSVDVFPHKDKSDAVKQACKNNFEYVWNCMKSCGYCTTINSKQDKVYCRDVNSDDNAKSNPFYPDDFCSTVTENDCRSKSYLKLACCETCMKFELDITGDLACADTWATCGNTMDGVSDTCCPSGAPTSDNRADKDGRQNWVTRCRDEHETQKNCLSTCKMCTGAQQDCSNNDSTKCNDNKATRFVCRDHLKDVKGAKEGDKKRGCLRKEILAKCPGLTDYDAGDSRTNPELAWTCCASCIKQDIENYYDTNA